MLLKAQSFVGFGSERESGIKASFWKKTYDQTSNHNHTFAEGISSRGTKNCCKDWNHDFKLWRIESWSFNLLSKKLWNWWKMKVLDYNFAFLKPLKYRIIFKAWKFHDWHKWIFWTYLVTLVDHSDSIIFLRKTHKS